MVGREDIAATMAAAQQAFKRAASDTLAGAEPLSEGLEQLAQVRPVRGRRAPCGCCTCRVPSAQAACMSRAPWQPCPACMADTQMVICATASGQ